ncbi:protein disks lost [Uranotaenia lowii]|uniref:protein disks lost n=1 Tax=Uranotaenia lowii TaxID=190385 RepID=UPI0024783B0F|nr:protein disks lost [Uranotaenia lowii]
MAEQLLEAALAAKFESEEEFPSWFLQQFKKNDTTSCTIEEFAVHFLGLIRSQTEDFTKCAPSMCDTPKNVIPTSSSAPSGRKLSITTSSSVAMAAADDDQPPASITTTSMGTTATTTYANNGNAPISVSNEPSQLPATSASSHEMVPQMAGKVDTTTLGATGSAGRRSISRDLFVGSSDSVLEDDFQTGFQNIDQDKARCQQKNKSVLSISEVPSSPVANFTARLQGQTPGSMKIDSHSNTSTPVRHASKSNAALQLSTSTPIASTSARSSKLGSRSAYGMDCSTPGSRHESRKSHDKSFGNNSSRLSLGDFITNSSMKSNKSRKSTGSKDTSRNDSLFLENDFPSLGSPVNSTPGKEHLPQNRNKKRVTPITVSKTLTTHLGGSSFELENAAPASPVNNRSQRRIVPTSVLSDRGSISGNKHDFNSSSFKSDNNLMNLTEDSLELDMSQKDERGLLRNYKDIIKSTFEAAEEQNVDTNRMLQTALRNSINTPRKLSESALVPPIRIDLAKVTRKQEIERLVHIYSLLIDLNLTPNVLSEIAYLINLVNTESDPFDTASSISSDQSDESVNYFTILKNVNNCVYFALEVLQLQKSLLALLDSTSLKVLVENERINGLCPSLNGFLREIHGQKLQLDGSVQRMLDMSVKLVNGGNVFYQQEADTKEHFPSDKEFGAFKKQRDAFCTIYRTWDFKHLNPTWNFLAELRPKIRALLAIMEHPINMAHLAKLFTAQLVQACNFENSPSELAIALPNVDPAKLVKLRQRLVAPSQFSTQYLFPGSQAFFRDFIIATEANQIFTEQLKAVLIHELLEMNGSSYEVLNVSGPESQQQHGSEYVVRPESTTTMRVLAKFVGFIISRPLNYDSYRNSTVDNRQLELRNSLLPLFDVKSILLKAIAERKLIITIPWLVQYLAMLDGISLRLDYYKELFDILYELYLRTTTRDPGPIERKLLVTPTSKFIIRVSLGWLFEQPHIPEEYYSYRQERRTLLPVDEGLQNFKKIELLVDKSTAEDLERHRKALVLTKVNNDSGKGTTSTSCFELKPFRDESIEIQPRTQEEGSKSDAISLNPVLESILNAACPFLADFRVSMMPSRLEKTVSRSGRYRHITTKYSGSTTMASAKHKQTNDQHRLLDAFLQSQSLSVRRTVEFIIERASSAAIKDFQIVHLIPARKQVTEQIAQLRADSTAAASKQIYLLCSTALTELNSSWDAKIPPMLARRIRDGFDALLPTETLHAVKETCVKVAIERCLVKSNEWRQTHMTEIDLFCKDIPGEASKAATRTTAAGKQNFQIAAVTSSSNAAVAAASPLTVVLDRVLHTTVYEHLQVLVHQAAYCPEELNSPELERFLDLCRHYLNEQDGTPVMNRMLAFTLLQMALLLVINRCDLMTPDVLQAFLSLWKHPKLVEFCTTPESADRHQQRKQQEEDEIEQLMKTTAMENCDRSMVDEEEIMRIRQRQQQEDANYVFSTLVSNRYIRMMEAARGGRSSPSIQSQNQDQAYRCFANFINALVQSELISIRRLNEQFVKIFSEDWQQQTLERVSRLMDAVLRGGDEGPSAAAASESSSTGEGGPKAAASGQSSSNSHGAGGSGSGRRKAPASPDDSHSQLFLEMLSDLAREIEDF